MRGRRVGHDVEHDEQCIAPGECVVVLVDTAPFGVGVRIGTRRIVQALLSRVGNLFFGKVAVLAVPVANYGEVRRVPEQVSQKAPIVQVPEPGPRSIGRRLVEAECVKIQHVAEVHHEVVHAGCDAVGDLRQHPLWIFGEVGFARLELARRDVGIRD